MRAIPRKEAVLLVALLTLLGCMLVPLASKLATAVGDSSRVVRIAAPRHELVESTLSPYGPGFEQELMASFARGAGYEIEWLDVEDAGEAWQALSDGDADMAVGGGVSPGRFRGRRRDGRTRVCPLQAHAGASLQALWVAAGGGFVRRPRASGRGACPGAAFGRRHHLPGMRFQFSGGGKGRAWVRS